MEVVVTSKKDYEERLKTNSVAKTFIKNVYGKDIDVESIENLDEIDGVINELLEGTNLSIDAQQVYLDSKVDKDDV